MSGDFVGDSNTLSLDWECGPPHSNCRYYAKPKEDGINTAMCNPGLTQSIGTTHYANLLDLVFTNFDNLVVTFVHRGIVKADTLHRPMVTDTDLVLHKSTYIFFEHYYRKCAAGDYNILHKIL